MRSRIRAAVAALCCAAGLALTVLAGCGGPDQPAHHAGATDPQPKPTGDTPPARPLACQLPEPKKSDDACATDADCGVSDPCHAKACVAKAKSRPPAADTVCTRSLECFTADANRCGCYEGKCALIPPKS